MVNDEEKVMNIIKEYCGEDVCPDTDLIADGRLDSFALINILAALEDMGIDIDPAEEGIDGFSTPRKITALVRKPIFKN